MADKNSFGWGNYFSPTPKNVQYLVEGLKGIIATAAISTFVSGNEKYAFYMLIAGAVLDQAAKFFGRVAHDVEEQQIIVTGKDVQIDVEPKKEP